MNVCLMTGTCVEGFYKGIWSWVAIIAVAVPLFASTEYVEARFTLEWRNWLSHELLRGYYADRAFYKLGHQRSIDNPDQARQICACCWLCLHVREIMNSAACGCSACATTCPPSARRPWACARASCARSSPWWLSQVRNSQA